VELACLAFFSFRLIHERFFSDKTIFWRDTKLITYVVILGLTVVDVIIFVVTKNTVGRGVRWSR
jgi:hypothetical protein